MLVRSFVLFVLCVAAAEAMATGRGVFRPAGKRTFSAVIMGTKQRMALLKQRAEELSGLEALLHLARSRRSGRTTRRLSARLGKRTEDALAELREILGAEGGNRLRFGKREDEKRSAVTGWNFLGRYTRSLPMEEETCGIEQNIHKANVVLEAIEDYENFLESCDLETTIEL